MKKTLFTTLALALTLNVFAQNTEQRPMPKNDAEITNSLMTVNTQEISLAKVAKEKAQNPEVKKYAEEMFNAHAKSNDEANKWAKKTKTDIKETLSSNQLKVDSESKVEELKLQKLTGKEFDKAYMESQVKMHQKALDKIDKNLIPNAKDAELKAMLQSSRTKVQSHLQHAQKIQNTLL